MIASNVLTTRALAPIDLLVGSWRSFLGVRQSYQRLSALLDEFDADDVLVQKLAPAGALRLEGISAGAPSALADQPPLIHNIQLTLEPGSITGLMGPSGCGKSTLAKVLLGIWPASQGAVWWGERPLDAWSPEERGPAVGYLPQDCLLYTSRCV